MKPKNGDPGGRIMWESEGPFGRVAGRDKISEPARKNLCSFMNLFVCTCGSETG
ncbi:hypothetical protein COLO4_16045 [Corchorus olitorius]|uniref:Uncharacterized protein n=1 Tax=Corchorus olitorius TaxID=93759 RepID=A0A1R3JK36_9ROSI|nr:hypothetical protein COLO4_16045 [Corchorus olitorius]